MISKKYRISREKIPYILKKGAVRKTNLFTALSMDNQEGINKFRVIVSKKTGGGAVERNLLRRRIYEALRTSIKDLPAEIGAKNTILIPKKISKDKTFGELKEEVLNIILSQNGKSK